MTPDTTTAHAAQPAADLESRSARERILDAAEELFAERGYAATTTKLVAGTAGVSAGLVFYHFSSKQHLLESLLAERTFGHELRALLSTADPADVRGTLREVVTRLYGLLARRQRLVRIMLQLASSGGGTDGLAIRLSDLLRDELTRLAEWLVDALGPDGVTEQEALVAAQALMSSALTSVAVVGLPPSMTPEGYLATTVDVLLDGVAPANGVTPGAGGSRAASTGG